MKPEEDPSVREAISKMVTMHIGIISAYEIWKEITERKGKKVTMKGFLKQVEMIVTTRAYLKREKVIK